VSAVSAAPSRWRASPARLLRLVAGLILFGTGDAFLVAGGLGNTPWTVLAEGIAERLGLSIGVATFVVSVAVLLAWIPLRERPGLGTVLNVVLISVAIDVTLALLAEPDALVLRVAALLAGVALIGLGSGFYLTAALGPGPRDGWMTGLHRRTGRPIWLVRLAIEGSVVVAGALLGGTLGIGTLVFTALIGPAVDLGIRLAGGLGPDR